MLNKIFLMGRLTKDPELRRTQSGTAVASFSIAVDRDHGKKGEDKETDFIDIVAWRSTAEFVCKYFTKGQLIALSGRIQSRSYEDKTGSKRTAVEVVAEQVSFCGPKKDRESAPERPADPIPTADYNLLDIQEEFTALASCVCLTMRQEE